jgi:hypothetical protein
MKPSFNNADYWQDMDRDTIFEGPEEALRLVKKGRYIVGVHAKLLITDAQGIYIPQLFCENFDIKAWGLRQVDSDVDVCLAGPDEEWYWEAWNAIIQKAQHHDKYGCTWHLEQDGDLFAICYVEYDGEDDEDEDDDLPPPIPRSNPYRKEHQFKLGRLHAMAEKSAKSLKEKELLKKAINTDSIISIMRLVKSKDVNYDLQKYLMYKFAVLSDDVEDVAIR